MTAKERKVLIHMYEALERLPGEIRRDEARNMTGSTLELERMAMGADRARVVVYSWLVGEGGLLPRGGR
jgi:hypothetical protein